MCVRTQVGKSDYRRQMLMSLEAQWQEPDVLLTLAFKDKRKTTAGPYATS